VNLESPPCELTSQRSRNNEGLRRRIRGDAPRLVPLDTASLRGLSGFEVTSTEIERQIEREAIPAGSRLFPPTKPDANGQRPLRFVETRGAVARPGRAANWKQNAINPSPRLKMSRQGR